MRTHLSSFLLTMLFTFFCEVEVCSAQKLKAAFDSISKIDGFEIIDTTAEKEGFPKVLGNLKMTCYGNAEPRDKVLNILSKLPDKLLGTVQKYGEKRMFFYIEKEPDGSAAMMRVFVGTGGNDLCAWLFTGASYQTYKDIVATVKNEE